MLSSIQKREFIRKGAEATVSRVSWHGLDCVLKERVQKAYRHPVLDQELRTTRTRKEARLIHQLKTTGIRVPYLYHVDLRECSILMERIEGELLKDAISASSQSGDEERVRALLASLGEMVGTLHDNNFIHGDLTSSNVIVTSDSSTAEGFSLVLIDLGLGAFSGEVENKGVDLHVLLEAFQSTHSELLELRDVILDAYRERYDGAGEVVAKVEEIERRGRYR